MLAVKKVAIIPTLLTLGNATCGFAAIAAASKIGRGEASASAHLDDPYFALSGLLIIAAMVFDALDGYVARLSKSASNFGMQLDSLCDAISFGVAPAFLILRLGPRTSPVPQLHQALAVIAALYMACTLLRLARFNIETAVEPNVNKRFRGLPSPGAAGCIATLAILRGELAKRWPALDADAVRLAIEVWTLLGALTVALLMVSRVPYPHLTKQILRGRRPFSHLVQIILAGVVIILVWDLAFAFLFWLYALGIPLRYVLARNLRRVPGHALSSGSEEPIPH